MGTASGDDARRARTILARAARTALVGALGDVVRWTTGSAGSIVEGTHTMALRKKKTLLDQAQEYVDAVRPHVESAVATTRDAVEDFVENTARRPATRRTGPAGLADARDKAARDRRGPREGRARVDDARAKAGPRSPTPAPRPLRSSPTSRRGPARPPPRPRRPPTPGSPPCAARSRRRRAASSRSSRCSPPSPARSGSWPRSSRVASSRQLAVVVRPDRPPAAPAPVKDAGGSAPTRRSPTRPRAPAGDHA